LKCFGDIAIDLSEQVKKEQIQKMGKLKVRPGATEDAPSSHAVKGSILQESRLPDETTRALPKPVVINKNKLENSSPEEFCEIQEQDSRDSKEKVEGELQKQVRSVPSEPSRPVQSSLQGAATVPVRPGQVAPQAVAAPGKRRNRRGGRNRRKKNSSAE
jgi:hypothetical protein